jgi:hypothetical protein
MPASCRASAFFRIELTKNVGSWRCPGHDS